MESYLEELAKLAYDAAKQNKKITPNYIDKIVEIVCDHKDLANYLHTIEFSGNQDIYYDAVLGVIGVDLKYLFSIINEVKPSTITWGKKEQKLLKYLSVNQFILHELEHTSQFKKRYEPDNTLQYQIIKSSFQIEHNLLFNYNNSFQRCFYKFERVIKEGLYLIFYDICPLERLAEVNSLKDSIKTSQILECNHLSRYFHTLLYDKYLASYEYCSNPTVCYFIGLGDLKAILTILKFIKSLDFKTRLELGLNLTKPEQNHLIKKQQELSLKLYR